MHVRRRFALRGPAPRAHDLIEIARTARMFSLRYSSALRLLDMRLAIETLNLNDVERLLCVDALNAAGTIIEAASLLGITRHALKRRILKHQIEWPIRRAYAPGLPIAQPLSD